MNRFHRCKDYIPPLLSERGPLPDIPEGDDHDQQSAFLQHCFALLNASETFAGRYNNPGLPTTIDWKIKFLHNIHDEISRAVGGVSLAEQCIMLDHEICSHASPGAVAGVLAHELGHGHQFQQRLSPNASHTPAEMVILNRKLEGDAVAFHFTVARDAHDNGASDMWDELVESVLDNPDSHYYGCMTAFLNTIDNNPDTYWNGEAQNAVIVAWAQSRDLAQSYDPYMLHLYRRTIYPTRAETLHNKHAFVSDPKKIDTALFRMPYATQDDQGRLTFAERPLYGKFTPQQQRTLNRITLPATLNGIRRLADYRPAQVRPKV